MSYTIIRSILVFSLISSPLLHSSEISHDFGDEAAAIQFSSSFAGEEANKLLASIRFKHSAKIYKLSSSKDISEWRIKKYKNLSLDYGMSALSLDPDNPKIKLLVTNLLLERGDDASLAIAESLSEELYQQDSSITNTLLVASIYQQRGLQFKAIPLYESFFTNDPKFYDDDVILLLNQSYITDYQYKRGIQFFTKIIQRMPWLDSAIMAKALLQKLAGEKQNSIQTLQTLLEQRSPNSNSYLYALEQINALQAFSFNDNQESTNE